MAEFDPSQGPSPIQGAQEAVSGLADKWRNWIGDERNRTAMIQFGINLMQPIGYGQTPLGHLGQAIGAAGEAVSRRKKEDIAEEEAGSKQTLREAQAVAAEAGAAGREQTATAREIAARAAAERARLYGELGYGTEAAKAQKDFLEAQVINPKMTEEQFLEQRKRFQQRIPGGAGTPPTVSGAAIGGGGGTTPQQYIPKQVYTFTDKTGHTFRLRYIGGDPNNRANWAPP